MLRLDQYFFGSFRFLMLILVWSTHTQIYRDRPAMELLRTLDLLPRIARNGYSALLLMGLLECKDCPNTVVASGIKYPWSTVGLGLYTIIYKIYKNTTLYLSYNGVINCLVPRQVWPEKGMRSGASKYHGFRFQDSSWVSEHANM